MSITLKTCVFSWFFFQIFFLSLKLNVSLIDTAANSEIEERATVNGNMINEKKPYISKESKSKLVDGIDLVIPGITIAQNSTTQLPSTVLSQ